MSILSGSEALTILRKVYGSADKYGQPTVQTTEIEVTGVLVSWGSTTSTEDTIRTTIASEVTFHLPAGTVVQDADRFRYRGEVWEQVGEAKYRIAPPSFGAWAIPVTVQANKVRG